MLNKEQIEGNWKQIKGGIRGLWGKITDDELDQAKGNMTKIQGIIEAKYGESKEEIKKKFNQMMESFDNETDKNNLKSESSYLRKPHSESDRTLH